MSKKKVGLGLAAAAAAAAGYYFYASKEAVKNRKVAAKWATGFKKDVVKQLKDSGVMDSAAVKSAVSKVEKAYKQAQDIDAEDIKRAAKELKDNWDSVASEIKKGVAKGKKQASSTAKKVVKEVKKRV
jgi:gas vesicle protein